MMILAVNVVGHGAPEADPTGAGRHGREPSGSITVRPAQAGEHFRQRHAGSGPKQPGSSVEQRKRSRYRVSSSSPPSFRHRVSVRATATVAQNRTGNITQGSSSLVDIAWHDSIMGEPVHPAPGEVTAGPHRASSTITNTTAPITNERRSLKAKNTGSSCMRSNTVSRHRRMSQNIKRGKISHKHSGCAYKLEGNFSSIR